MVEVMLVIAIMAVTLAIGIPAVFQGVRKSPIRQAIGDLQEGCRSARMMAIMQGRTAEMVIRAEDGQIVVRPAPEQATESSLGAGGSADPSLTLAATETADAGSRPPASRVPGFSAHLSESVAFKVLKLNQRDQMDFDETRVRFFPNGTCDEFDAVLLADNGEERRITLEITTAREQVQVIR
jgi:type II secretory pathway pseudopilin PulG